jgi:hypothetical protein
VVLVVQVLQKPQLRFMIGKPQMAQLKLCTLMVVD